MQSHTPSIVVFYFIFHGYIYWFFSIYEEAIFISFKNRVTKFFFCEGKPSQREELTIRICISRDTHLSISPSEQVIRKKQGTKKKVILRNMEV